MGVMVADRPMAKKRNDVSVKIDAEAVRIAKIVAAYRDMTLAEYISRMVLTGAKADLAEEQAKNPAADPPSQR